MSTNSIEVVLVVTDDCPACERAREIWTRACAGRAIALRVHQADSVAESALAAGQTLTTVPAVLVGGRIVAVGLQTPDQVHAILDRHLHRTAGH